jgi:secreted PhoX family phosphatase
MASLGRRNFMTTSGSATLGLALATLVTRKQARASDFGALVPDPKGILNLPAGFSYRILEAKGNTMTDGYRVPGRPDGMACFAGPNNTLILMRNHEVTRGDASNGPYKGGQKVHKNSYDPKGMGCVTRLVVSASTFGRISSNLVLTGTVRNCGGGPSPWGWISCEENIEINGAYRHGYAFLCRTDKTTVQPPVRLNGYGRFNHEAVAVDPSNYHAYLTEDRSDGCLYRFVPNNMGQPFVGKLQALKVVGEDQYNTDDMTVGEAVDVEWVDIVSPDPNSDTVRSQAHAKGAAIILRGEGIWFFEGQIYICSTSGGQNGGGHVFRLIDGDSPTLELMVASPGLDVLDSPDNITMAPWGELFLVEDGDGEDCIRYVTDHGEILPFACNVGSSSEFAGVCFSPNGAAMFVNLQTDGLTLVVTGPFPNVMNADVVSLDKFDDLDELDESTWEVLSQNDTGSNCSVTDEPSDGAGLLAAVATVSLATLGRDRQ